MSFLSELCKVEAVCTLGEPNWMGWLAIAVLASVLVGALIAVGAWLWLIGVGIKRGVLWPSTGERIVRFAALCMVGILVWFIFWSETQA